MKTKTQLKQLYSKYINSVMEAGMSTSFEATLYILDFLARSNFNTICDMSCGFTTVALHDVFPNIVTIHDNKEGLEKTGLFMQEEEIPTANIMYSEDISFGFSADFILYKFSDDGQKRFKNFSFAYNSLSPKGTMYIDDMHGVKSEYRANIEKLAQISACEFKLLNIETFDCFGRYGALLTKP